VAWTFRAGELPLFIWIFSIIGFLPLAVLTIIFLRRYERRKDSGACGIEPTIG
jgi:hypothetical protein